MDEMILQLIGKYLVLPAIAVYLVLKWVSITEKILARFEVINRELGELTLEIHTLIKELSKWRKS